jgi:hypothetical protein
MALPPNAQPTNEQRAAFYVVLDYCLRERAAKPEEIEAAAKINHEEYQNFRRGKTGAHYQSVSAFIASVTLARLKKINRIPAYMKPVIEVCFPNFFADKAKTITSPNDVFLRHANLDPNHRNEISEAYSGIFNVYRYSSHLNKPPAPLPLETSADGKHSTEDPWMICAGLEVFEAAEHDHFVRFKLHYRPYEEVEGSISVIDGIIISIKELLYFVGLEHTRYPLIIMSVPHLGRKIEMFTGMILRYHEYNRTIASRVGFHRAAKGVKSMDELDRIGMERESKLIEEITPFGRRLINTVNYDGKCALLATLP